MLETHTVQTAGWETTVAKTTFTLSPSIVTQCLELVAKANAAFVREDTAAWSLLGEPGAVGRLDFTITGADGEQLLANGYNGRFPQLDGIVRPYEWEERPGGLGVTGVLNPQFADSFQEIRRDWPYVRVAVEEGRRGWDDHLWAGDEHVTLGAKVPDDGTLVLVRAEPENDKFHHLGSRCVTTLRTKGDKSYGANLGWWQEVKSLDELPSVGGIVVLKPVQGSKTKGLLMSAPGSQTQPGMVTRTKMERLFTEQVERHGRMYLQPWHSPIEVDGANLILRVFFGRGYSSPEWHCLGGVWNIRKSAVVHGARDTLFGPAILG
jgi:hypothetical protein